MKTTSSLLIGLGLACGVAHAAELAYTVRPTEVKAKPFSDASTLASLAERSRVDVLQRQASWIQVNVNQTTGWVRMLSLRFDQGSGPRKANDGGLGLLFNVAQTGSGGSTPTTGVKGISEESLRNPHPNPAALQQMNDYQASKADGGEFARAGKLDPQRVDYVRVASTSGGQ